MRALATRFERPTSAKRWDTPLFIFERDDLRGLYARHAHSSDPNAPESAGASTVPNRAHSPPTGPTPEPPAESSRSERDPHAVRQSLSESSDGAGSGCTAGEAAEELAPDADAVFSAIYAALFGRRPPRAHWATREKPLLAPIPLPVPVPVPVSIAPPIAATTVSESQSHSKESPSTLAHSITPASRVPSCEPAPSPAFAAPALGATDLLYSLDQLTQKVVASVLAAQRTRAPGAGAGAGGRVRVGAPRRADSGGAGEREAEREAEGAGERGQEQDEEASFAPRSGARVSPADLARARRQFLVYARSHAHAFAIMPADLIRQEFLHYLNETL